MKYLKTYNLINEINSIRELDFETFKEILYDLTDDYGGEIEIINNGETFVFCLNNYLKSFSNISNLRGTTRKSSMNFNNDFYFNKKNRK